MDGRGEAGHESVSGVERSEAELTANDIGNGVAATGEQSRAVADAAATAAIQAPSVFQSASPPKTRKLPPDPGGISREAGRPPVPASRARKFWFVCKEIGSPTLAVFTFLSILLVAWQFFLETTARQIDSDFRAIDMLRAPGYPGKNYALNHLVARDISLSNFDLSCKTIGLEWADGRCRTPYEFQDIRIGPPEQGWIPNVPFLAQNGLGEAGSYATLGYHHIRSLNLSDQKIERAEIVGAVFENVTLARTLIESSKLTNSVFDGNFQDVKIDGTDLTGSVFSGNINGFTAQYGVVSDVRIENGGALSTDAFEGSAAWSDRLPRISNRWPRKAPQTGGSTGTGTGTTGGWFDNQDKLDELANRAYLKTLIETAEPDQPIALRVLEEMRLCSPPERDGKPVPDAERPDLRTYHGCDYLGAEEALVGFKAVLKEEYRQNLKGLLDEEIAAGGARGAAAMASIECVFAT